MAPLCAVLGGRPGGWGAVCSSRARRPGLPPARTSPSATLRVLGAAHVRATPAALVQNCASCVGRADPTLVNRTTRQRRYRDACAGCSADSLPRAERREP